MMECEWQPAPKDFNLMSHEIHVYRISLDVAPETLDDYFQLLNKEEKLRAKRFHFLKHQRRFTVARANLRLLLAQYLSIQPEQVEFSYSEYGKPELPQLMNPLQLSFNLSHSHEMALLGLTVNALLGVDLEYPRKQRPEMDIAKRFFCEREFAALVQLPEEQQQAGFFNAWTRKEAFIKAVGQGLSYPLDEFAVSLAPGEPAQMLWIKDSADVCEQWQLRAFSPGDNYYAALATKQRVGQLKLFDYSLSPK